MTKYLGLKIMVADLQRKHQLNHLELQQKHLSKQQLQTKRQIKGKALVNLAKNPKTNRYLCLRLQNEQDDSRI